jgi:DNA-binding GntR family transcriptional regulator
MNRDIDHAAGARPPRAATVTGGDAHSMGAVMLRRLRADIVSARLAPGTKLALQHLAREYGAGVTPLRDALAQLAGDGLVSMVSQKGFRVAPVSAGDLADLSDIRLRVELMALGMALDRGGADWAARLQSSYGVFSRVRQRVGDDEPVAEAWESRHRAMHMALLSGCGSPTLMRFVGQIHDRFHRYRRIAQLTRSYMAALDDDHGDIADAAIGGDRARCVSLLERHIVQSSRMVRDTIRFDPAPA